MRKGEVDLGAEKKGRIRAEVKRGEISQRDGKEKEKRKTSELVNKDGEKTNRKRKERNRGKER